MTKIEKLWAAGLGVLLSAEFAVLFYKRKKLKEQLKEFDKMNEETERFIKEHEAYLENLTTPRYAAEVELEDGTKMDFGDYLDLKLNDIFGEDLES